MSDRALLVGKYFHCRGGIHMPFGWLSVMHGDQDSRQVMALLDTGSGYNVLSMEFATEMLGKEEDEIRSIPTTTAEGFGGHDTPMYPLRADLRLRASQDGKQFLTIPNAWIFVAEKTTELWPAIFGQLTGFQQLWMKHHNHSQNRFWQLTQQQ